MLKCTVGWMGIPKNAIGMLPKLTSKWKTRLEVWNNREKKTNRWIDINCDFLQLIVINYKKSD